MSTRITRRTLSATTAAALLAARTSFAQSTPEASDTTDSLQDKLYPERNWEDGRVGEINLSSFSFRDVDRDGNYSLGDFPFLGVNVLMVTPDGKEYIQLSNLHGFSNFSASVIDANAPIRTAGDHTFTIVPPKGWHVTTDNQTQTVSVTEAPGSIGGLVMNHLPLPFGIAPDLELRGNAITLAAAFGDTEIIATSPEGTQFLIEADNNGQFALEASSGDWQISSANGSQPPRVVSVGVHPVIVSSTTDSITPEERTASTKMEFDDLRTDSNLRKVPNGYGGVNWSGLNAISNYFYPEGEGYTNCTQSGDYVAYSSSGHAVNISLDRPFDFVGGFFGVAWSMAEGETIRFKAYQGDTLIAEDAFEGSAYGAVYFSANYRSITSLEITTDHAWQFVADDMEFIVPR